MVNKLEIERKWLIKFPLSFDNMKEVWNHAIKIEDIYQFYLKSEKGVTDRIRKSIEFGRDEKSAIFYRTIKRNLSQGIIEEDNFILNRDEYDHFIEIANKDLHPIYKTRYTFDYKNQIFELDIFNKQFKGLAILEIELNDLEQKVILPHFLCPLLDVTDNKKYKNSNMAKLNSLQAKKLIV
jgi:CYTH domain-containing protein